MLPRDAGSCTGRHVPLDPVEQFLGRFGLGLVVGLPIGARAFDMKRSMPGIGASSDSGTRPTTESVVASARASLSVTPTVPFEVGSGTISSVTCWPSSMSECVAWAMDVAAMVGRIETPSKSNGSPVGITGFPMPQRPRITPTAVALMTCRQGER